MKAARAASTSHGKPYPTASCSAMTAPHSIDFGLVRKFVDKCSTQVNQAHQKLRIASMTGLFDGAPVHTYTTFPSGFISFDHFVFIDVTHGGCD